MKQRTRFIVAGLFLLLVSCLSVSCRKSPEEPAPGATLTAEEEAAMNRLALFDAKREELQKECATLSERSQAKEIAMLAVYDADGDGTLSSSENEQFMEDYPQT